MIKKTVNKKSNLLHEYFPIKNQSYIEFSKWK